MRSTGDSVAFSWLGFPTAQVAARAVLDVSGATGLGLLLALVGLWMLRRAGEHANAVWLGVWAFSPFVVSLLVSLAKPVFLDRYLIVAAPAFALLGGAALVAVSQRWRLALVAVVVAGDGDRTRASGTRPARAVTGAARTGRARSPSHRSVGATEVVVVPWWAGRRPSTTVRTSRTRRRPTRSGC